MAKVRLLNGKPLMVGGKVALSNDCCCSTPTGCDCPLPDEECPHSLAISIKFDDADSDEQDFLEFHDTGGIAIYKFDNHDGTHTIEVYGWAFTGTEFSDFVIPDAQFFNVFHNICVKFNRVDDDTVNVASSIEGFGSDSFTMASVANQSIEQLLVGSISGSGGAHRTIQCVTLLANPDSAEEDFQFPADSFDSFTGGASIVGGVLRIDAASGDAYAEKDFDPGYNLDCLTEGACCRESVCTIETQASCESDGGVYQGDATVCDPNPCPVCPCQPRHMSISWTATDTGDAPAGEPTFNESFTAEVDIPVLDSACSYSYSDCRLFTGITDCPDAIISNPTGCFELSLHYDSGSNLWVVSFDILVGDHSIKCNGFEAWPHPDSVVLSIDGSSGTRTFSCPTATISEDLTGGSWPNFTGHGTVIFT